MGKSRHRRDYDNYDDEEFYNRADKFRERRERRYKKIHDHDENLANNEHEER